MKVEGGVGNHAGSWAKNKAGGQAGVRAGDLVAKVEPSQGLSETLGFFGLNLPAALTCATLIGVFEETQKSSRSLGTYNKCQYFQELMECFISWLRGFEHIMNTSFCVYICKWVET